MDSYSGLDVFQSYSAIMSEGDDFSKLSGEMHPEKTASSAAEGVFIHTPCASFLRSRGIPGTCIGNAEGLRPIYRPEGTDQFIIGYSARIFTKSFMMPEIPICCGHTFSHFPHPRHASGLFPSGRADTAIGAMNPPLENLCSL